MKFWIYIDGQQQGPYTLEELFDKPIDSNTKVWFEGLPKWYPAGTLDELKPLFNNTEVNERNESIEANRVVDTNWVSSPDIPNSTTPVEPCPPTYLGWTIFLTICCCSPISLAGLIASFCVSSYYNSGRIDKARKASEVAAWLIMVAIALGMLPAMFTSMMFGS